MALVPKSFKLPDYQARALHDYAVQNNKSDGELLRDLVNKYLEDMGYDPYAYIPTLSTPARTRR